MLGQTRVRYIGLTRGGTLTVWTSPALSMGALNRTEAPKSNINMAAELLMFEDRVHRFNKPCFIAHSLFYLFYSIKAN